MPSLGMSGGFRTLLIGALFASAVRGQPVMDIHKKRSRTGSQLGMHKTRRSKNRTRNKIARQSRRANRA